MRAVKIIHDNPHAGATTTRYLRDKYYIDATCRQVQREGRLKGSRLVVSGAGMRSLHGHGYVGMSRYDAKDLRKTFRENVTRGMDFFKVFVTKVVNVISFIYHSIIPEELRAMVEEAESINITTACHCPEGQGLDDCLTTGIDCLEYTYYITKEQVERVRKMGRWVVYMLSYALNDDLLLKFSPYDKEGSLREKEIICGYLSETIAGGLRFGTGIDGLHGNLVREIQCIAQLGASNRNAPAGATAQAVKLRGVDQIADTVKEGLAVDLVIMDGSPLKDIKALPRVEHVIQGGNAIR